MTASRYGTAKKVGEKHVLRYERRLAYSVESVWAAITEPERIAQWLAAADQLELQVGGAVLLRWLNLPDDIGQWEAEGVQLDDAEPSADVHGTVTRLEPRRLLEYDTDAMGLMRFELEPDDEGTLLVFINEIILPDAFPAEQTLAGWHVHLDTLERALAGQPADWAHWTEDRMGEWKRVRERYAAAAEGRA